MSLALVVYLILTPIILVLLLGYDWRWIWKLRHIPGPTFLNMFIGHFPVKGAEFMHYRYLFDWPTKFGPIYKVFLGQKPYIVVTDPALIEQICTRQFAKFRDRVPLPTGAQVTEDDRTQFEANLFWASGKKWGAVRSACEPLFHASSLKAYIPLMHDSLDQWMNLLGKMSAGGKSVNVLGPINSLAMSNLGKANFGVDFDCLTAEPVRLVREAFLQMDPPKDYVGEFIALMFLPMFIPLLKQFFAWLYQYGCFSKRGDYLLFRFAQSEGYINGTTKALIKNVRNGGADPQGKPAVDQPSKKGLTPYRYHQLVGQATGAAVYKDRVPIPGSFIPKLVEAKIRIPGEEVRNLTDLEIVAQAYTMIIAGAESPANGMAQTIFEIAKNPVVQARMIEEIDALGPMYRVQFEDLPKLSYTEAVFQEGLRLHPVGNPMFSPCRVCTKDTELGGYHIPAGVGIMLNSTGVSRSPDLFPDPDAFKPERHIPGTPIIGPETRPPTAHMPFGYGPHGCIGKKFALEQAVLLLSRFFQTYTVTVDETRHPPGVPMRHRTGITFQPDGKGLYVHLHPRHTVSRSEE